jgi:predicted lipoprotein with Yx(FWY)xxD motif
MGTYGTRFIGLVVVIFLVAVGLAACGDDDEGDGSANAAAGDPVSVETIDGTDVLVDADGRALYTSDQEQAGRVVCTEGCTAIWDPLLVSDLGANPEDLGADFGSVARPDGGRQLTLSESPLYRFTEEGPGELSGDGVVDSFDGTEFTWSAATSGAEPASDGSSSPSDGGPYGY